MYTINAFRLVIFLIDNIRHCVTLSTKLTGFNKQMYGYFIFTELLSMLMWMDLMRANQSAGIPRLPMPSEFEHIQHCSFHCLSKISVLSE